MAQVQESIEKKLHAALAPAFLSVENESHNHNVPAGSESHFKVVIVSDQFEGKQLLARHRLVNAALKEELQGTIHALALHTLTPSEWAARGGETNASPPCLGGGK
ncbi:BolA/IbaG family iron-sulfur metabolism protein [Granulosicoccaceae sp. 1_MG-2023]|nr:BolA/IbaG family iron-sulfur metabolism protein [Granulosicoccaceae sp. 1_MG-2023]